MKCNACNKPIRSGEELYRLDTLNCYDCYFGLTREQAMTTADTSHLVALLEGLSHAREYLKDAMGVEVKALRSVWVKQLEKEVEAEYAFLGIAPAADCDISDDDLLSALGE